MASGIAAVAASAVMASAVWPPRLAFVWNASASSPIGLYLVTSEDLIRAGDMVVAWAPARVRAMAAERHYLPSNVPLVKRVAAIAGDRVCAVGEQLFINDELVALRRRHDPSGRPLPRWSGCEGLGPGELFLIAPRPGSFDGRYFGVTEAHDVVGAARLLWPR